MPVGPKRAADTSPLPFASHLVGAERFAAFCHNFIRVPKGTGALSPLRVRDWQLELVGSVLDADETPRVAGWCLPEAKVRAPSWPRWGSMN